MFDSWKKNRAIKKYLNKMPCLLQYRYGPGDFYTKGQIQRTLIEENLSTAYNDYALSMFLSPEEVIDVFKDNETYKQLRKEIAIGYFHGNMNYRVRCNRKTNIGNEGHDSIDAFPSKTFLNTTYFIRSDRQNVSVSGGRLAQR